MEGEKEFGWVMYKEPTINFGIELGPWFIKVFLGYHSALVGWVEWEDIVECELEEE